MSGARWGRGREMWSPVEAFLLLGRAGPAPLPVRTRTDADRLRVVPEPSDGVPSTVRARTPAKRFVVLGPEDPVPSTIRTAAAAAIFARAATGFWRDRPAVVPPHQEVRP
ncbi:hypothetical protein [Umezawaea sp. Da 62-37]|uniref:hypothetical protein n=1 Tax=Umezawaea sp. Da 62-37 TaxID=3075927 RepID=UPI0028F6D9ED|nr:hypothetical protein [Umezawaea sp. Da 62-37]WNV84092.1 hypothetical protein RM788_38920 [Umezawaea sp. Da 62-37]